ncbi:MAG: DUF692 domain-containing protein [Pseudomonadota bacterium]|nr:DUF692 domain-containing protein [Pseudomonadota bacterium]
MASRPAVGFLEIHAENFVGAIGRGVLEDLRRDYPISVHAVGLSLASADGLNLKHLDRVAALTEGLEPMLVSDHLCWSSFGNAYFNDLLPFPYTEESLTVVATNIQIVQERLKRPILIENVSSYMRFRASVIDEGDFMAMLVGKTGCGLLCDVNNAYVNEVNHGRDARAWLQSLPADAVKEIHLAGHCVNEIAGGKVLIDDHGSAVIEPVWALYGEAVKRFRNAATLVEWDTDIPPLDILIAEAHKADAVRARGMMHADAA